MFSEEFSQVFIISHTDIGNVFDNNIRLEMKNDVTRLKEIQGG